MKETKGIASMVLFWHYFREVIDTREKWRWICIQVSWKRPPFKEACLPTKGELFFHSPAAEERKERNAQEGYRRMLMEHRLLKSGIFLFLIVCIGVYGLTYPNGPTWILNEIWGPDPVKIEWFIRDLSKICFDTCKRAFWSALNFNSFSNYSQELKR